MSRDLQEIGLNDDWYQVGQDRTDWCQRCLEGVDKVAPCRKKSSCAANSQSQGRTLCLNVAGFLGDREILPDTTAPAPRHCHSPG